jgi:hypothetical protein
MFAKRMKSNAQEGIMKLIGSIVAVLFSLALLGAMGFGAYLALQYILARFADLQPQVATVTGIACVVALTAAWMIAAGIRAASRQSKATALGEEKAATYRLFVEFWEKLLRQGRGRTDRLPADLSENLQVLDRLLALYGGTAVIKAHTALRVLEREKGALHPDVRAGLGEALVAIRRDLGTDTPRDAARELERLLLAPLDDADNTAGTRDARIHTALALGF